MSKVIIIGGGASGMMAACEAAECGHEVTLLEKNEKLGKKIFITGKGRCNVTNDCDPETFFKSVVTNSSFMYSSYYGFDSQSAQYFFENAGVRLKTERGNRVFPVSDHSSDIIRALSDKIKSYPGVRTLLNTEVKDILTDSEDGICHVRGVALSDGRKLYADRVVVATGGLSYPSTGSTGDGHSWARSLGLKITELSPALVPLETAENFTADLKGLSLKNVEIRITDGKKELYREFGEMLFTHFGVSGPLILTASSYVGSRLKKERLKLYIDLKPALTMEMLDKRILKEFDANRNRQFKNAVSAMFPASLTPVIVGMSSIPENKCVHDISKQERREFAELIKAFPMTLTGTRNYNEAIITKGGVNVKEIDPGTMECRKIQGLYFIGEVLDIDCVTGGFNLQVAWSTAVQCGRSL